MIFEFIKKLNLDKESVVIEIGAHMGFGTEKIKKNIGESNFFAFEYDNRNIKILRERGIDKIVNELITLAVSDKTGEETIYLSKGNPPEKTGNSYYDKNVWSRASSIRKPKIHLDVFPWCKFLAPQKIKSITLDEFSVSRNIKKIDFIWMDTKGCEDLVFNGGRNILNKTEYIYTEYSDKELYEGQLGLKDLLKILPGEWQIIKDFGKNALIRNNSLHDSLILKNGSWNTKDLNEHEFDVELCTSIIDYLKSQNVKTLVDLGCGPGQYVKKINESGIYSEGYDGNINTPYLSGGTCKVLDLTTDINLEKKFDCVLSLEVGEHIPEEFERCFIDNILKIDPKIIILSWAIPEQGGFGHINCKKNEYIIEKITSSSKYKYEKTISDILRNKSVLTWFKKTIMVFKKK